MSLNAEINLRTVIDTFAPEDDIRHALFLTYTFDGGILEDVDRGLLDLLWRRNCENVLVVRDGKAVLAEKRSHRYSVINAAYSRRTFHPKLMLLLTSSEVLAAIGSANLTRGGLESNLELVGVYRLTRSSGPLSLFRSLRDYLSENHLRRELAATSSQQRKAFDILQRDLDRFLGEANVARSPVEPLFLHNYDEALLPQIIKALPNQKLETMWIVSPFFEPDPGPNQSSDKNPYPDAVPLASKGDDPPDDRLDETLLKEVFKQLTFTQNGQPPVRIYFQASTANATRLPLNALQQFKSQIALYAKSSTIDSRNLHAKMLLFVGRDRSGTPFVTIVYGSANFTRAALLSTPPNGNAEIVVLSNLPQTRGLANKLDIYLNLEQLFTPINNWDSLTPQPALPLPTLHRILVWEGLVSLADQSVTVFFQVDHPEAHHVVMTLLGEQPDLRLGKIAAPFPDSYEFSLPEAALVTVNQELGLRQLPYHRVRVEAFDAAEKSLGWAEGALNVDCPSSFYGDWQADHIWQNTLDTQIYLFGLGNYAGYTALSTHIERALTAQNGTPPVPSHQADLDLFFRRLHIGFRGLRRRLEQTRGSPYVFGDILRQLAGWAEAVIQNKEQYLPEQQLYLCQRIVETALDCVGIMNKAKCKPDAINSIIQEELLGGLEIIQNYAGVLCYNSEIGIAAQKLVKQCNLLKPKIKGT